MSTSSSTLQMFTQQGAVTPCLLYILQPIYLHKLSPHKSSQPITSRIYQRLLCLLTNQIAHQFSTDQHYHLTLKMASAQFVETSVSNNSPSQDSNHPDDLFFNQGMLLLGSNYFFNNNNNNMLLIIIISLVSLGVFAV